MYQNFGAREVGETRTACFKLFIPDNTLDPDQYQYGELPGIDRVYVIGDFQENSGAPNWLPAPQFEMVRGQFTDPEDGKTKGWLYELTTYPLPKGFYQYKFHIVYLGGTTRVVCDPCTRYGGISDQNSGFVIGGPKMNTGILENPKQLQELVLYELMIDDFTAGIRGNKSPLTAVGEKLNYLKGLGINAIQFMPWTGWPGEDYDWGYEPQGYFAVAFRYTLNPADPSEKLFLLKRLISDCHALGIHVFFDGVFDHVTGSGSRRGFGYHWIWEEPDKSPFTGKFSGTGYGFDLDFHNGCVNDFIFDVCRYWVEEFAVDGIRFDYTAGFYDPQNEGTKGLPTLIRRLRKWLNDQGKTNFPLILEHNWEYGSIDVVNQVNATSCWLDPFRGSIRTYLSERHIKSGMMRLLDSGYDFAAGKTPVIYIENHDHESLMINAGSHQEWWRTQPYVIALLTASGAPMIHNGQEFGERYPMPEPFQEDSTAPPDSQDPARKRVVPRPLLWSRMDEAVGISLNDFYRRLIELRRTHQGLTSPNFHPSQWDEHRNTFDADGFGIDEERQLVIYHRWGEAADGHLEKFYIVLNFSESEQLIEMTLPENGGWTDLLSGWSPSVQNNRLQFNVGSNWGHIFYKKY